MDIVNPNEERKAFLKEIYDYCMRVEWRRADLDALATKLNKSRDQIRAWARMYVNTYLSSEERENVYEQINKLTRKDQENSRVKIAKVNPILYKVKGKVTYQLWETEEEKEMVLKYIYDTLEKSYYDINRVNEVSVFLGIHSEDKVLKYAKKYAIEYLGYSEEEYHNRRVEYRTKKLQLRHLKQKRVLKKDVYNKLLDAASIEEVIEIIDNCDFLVDSLRNSVYDYVVLYKNGNDDVLKNLRLKIQMYSNYVSQQKKEEDKTKKEDLENERKKSQLKLAQELIRKFLDEAESIEDNIDEFCNKNNVTRNVFDECVMIVKELDTKLFDLYKEKVNGFRNQRYAMIVSQIKNIIAYLKNGIEEFGVVRPFDLIDFYLYTNIYLKDIVTIARQVVSESEYRLLKRFVNENINGIINDPGFVTQIMKAKVIINYEKDKNGLLIPGTEEIFSNTEKEKLIRYLNENKIPVNQKTYNIVYRRYRNGTLNLNDESKKSKV